MSANTLHQPVSGANVEVSPTRNLRNVCHVFDHGTQEEDDPGTWEAPMPSGIQGMFAMYWRQSASTQQSKESTQRPRLLSYALVEGGAREWKHPSRSAAATP